RNWMCTKRPTPSTWARSSGRPGSPSRSARRTGRKASWPGATSRRRRKPRASRSRRIGSGGSRPPGSARTGVARRDGGGSQGRRVMRAERMDGALVAEITPAPEPIDACARFADLPGCLLLESMVRSERLGRYSFLAADPFRVLRSRGPLVEEVGPSGGERVEADPFTAPQRALARYRMDTLPGLPPFQGGAAGYFGYELGRHLEEVPQARYDDLALPDLCVGFYDWVLAWDHASGRAWLVSNGLPATGPERRARAEARAGFVRARLEAASSPGDHMEEPAAAAPAGERP